MNELCTLTKEQVTLYQAVVDDMLRRIEEAEGIARKGLVLDRHVAPQAGVQPPGPVPERRLRPARALGQARAGRRNPR